MIQSLGARLKTELARRGETGTYFKFEETRSLSNLETVEELREILDRLGFTSVVASEDVVQVANGLREARECDSVPWWVTLDPTCLLAPGVWILYKFVRAKPMFPSSDRPATDYNGVPLE